MEDLELLEPKVDAVKCQQFPVTNNNNTVSLGEGRRADDYDYIGHSRQLPVL